MSHMSHRMKLDWDQMMESRDQVNWSPVGREEEGESLMESPSATWQNMSSCEEMSWVQAGPIH